MLQKLRHTGGCLLCQITQSSCKHDLIPPVGIDKKDGTRGDMAAKLLLQTDGLRAKLDVVFGLIADNAVLVLDREKCVPVRAIRKGDAVRCSSCFHAVAFTADAKAAGKDRKFIQVDSAAAAFHAGCVDALVLGAPACGFLVFLPCLIECEQAAPAGTVAVLAQRNSSASSGT